MNRPTDDLAARAASDARDAALHRALRYALEAPPLPAGFRERLRAAIERAPATDLQAQRQRLERERRAALEDLRAGTLRLSRDALAVLVLCAFTVGACAGVLVPWLRERFGIDAGLGVAMVAGGGALCYALWFAGRPLLVRLASWLP